MKDKLLEEAIELVSICKNYKEDRRKKRRTTNVLDKLKQENPYKLIMKEVYNNAIEDVRVKVMEVMRKEQPCYASELARRLTGDDTNISGKGRKTNG